RICTRGSGKWFATCCESVRAESARRPSAAASAAASACTFRKSRSSLGAASKRESSARAPAKSTEPKLFRQREPPAVEQCRSGPPKQFREQSPELLFAQQRRSSHSAPADWRRRTPAVCRQDA